MMKVAGMLTGHEGGAICVPAGRPFFWTRAPGIGGYFFGFLRFGPKCRFYPKNSKGIETMKRLITLLAGVLFLAQASLAQLTINELNGFDVGGSAAPAPVTWTFVDQMNANASTISGGTGIQAGDLAILFDAASASGASPTNVVPSGWTQITTQIDAPGSTEFRNTISYKILQAGELTAGALNSITGMNAATSSKKIVLVFRPSAALSGITVSALQEQDAGTSAPSPQVIPTGSATLPAIAIGHFRGGADTTPTATGATVVQGNATGTQWSAYRIFNTSFSDQTISMTDAGNFNLMQSFYFTANQ